MFNRHGEHEPWDRPRPWAHEFAGGPLPIVENTSLSFINTGSDLIYAAAQLYHLDGDADALAWAKRLLGRYDEIRHPETRLGGYQFNHRDPCRVRLSFKPPLCERDDVNETTVITSGVIQTRFGRAAITFLHLFELLGEEDGREFLDFVVEDLRALAEHAYDFEARMFRCVLNDGTKLSPNDTVEVEGGYCPPKKLEPVPASGLLLLAYAQAHRLTGDRLLGEATHGLSQVVAPEPPPCLAGDRNDTYALLALLELHRATGQGAYLKQAVDYAERLVGRCVVQGVFVAGDETEPVVDLDHPLPLALLHLAAAVEGASAGQSHQMGDR